MRFRHVAVARLSPPMRSTRRALAENKNQSEAGEKCFARILFTQRAEQFLLRDTCLSEGCATNLSPHLHAIDKSADRVILLMMADRMKIYLDTNVYGRPFDDARQTRVATEAQASLAIIELKKIVTLLW